MATISEKLKIIRSEMQLSQRQLSRILFVSRGYVSELEISKKTPSPKVLKRIDRLYDSIPRVRVLTPVKVVKKSWFERLFWWVK